MTAQRMAPPEPWAEAQPSPRAGEQRRPGVTALRRWYGVSLPGAWGALILACLSFTPSLLPRSGGAQGVVAGISAALGYGLGVLAAAVWRAFADRGPRSPQRWAWPVFAVVAVLSAVVFFALGRQWQGWLRALMGMPTEPLLRALLAPVIALAAHVDSFRTGDEVREPSNITRSLSALPVHDVVPA